MTHTDLKEAAMRAIAAYTFYKTSNTTRNELAWLNAESELRSLATRARILSIIEENERMREALNDAIDCVEAWGGYASDYFKDKHDFQGDLDRLRAALKEKP